MINNNMKIEIHL